MKKRFIALLLCCVMLLTLSPSLISAASADDINGTTVETPTDEPTVEEPKTEEPKTEEPKTEEPKTEEPKTEEPKTEEPKTEEPKTEEPKADDETTIPAAEQSDAPVESEIITPAVNFTNVAPFLAPVTGIPVRSNMFKMGVRSLAMNEATDNGIVLNKTATANSNGSYTITLEAYATGEKVITETKKDVPTDIVLVLDQSGSMGNCIVCGKENSYGYHWTRNGWEKCTSRLSALKTAVRNFAEAVAKKAKGTDGQYGGGDDVDHRIAIVGFASEKSSGTYENTELLSTQKVVNYENATADNYKDALVSVNSNDSLNSRLSTAINRLGASGDTYLQYGMDMANKIFEQYPIASDDTSGRQRVVVVFTDGYPAPSGTDDFNYTMADDAIRNAHTTKDTYKATVYTVGVLDDADPTASITDGFAYNGSSFAQQTVASNRYMHYVSSNYPDATSMREGGNLSDKADPFNGGDSYYLSAGDADTLNNIFQQISQQIETGGSSTTLGKSAVIKDIISPQFTLPEDATADNITLETYACTGKDGDTYTWSSTSSGNDRVTATVDGDQVSVTGFDFAENYVGTVTENGNVSYRGHKLVINFTVSPKAGFLGGNNVYTNGNAGIYESDSAQTPVMTFDRPQVNVPIEDVTVTAEDKNVYLLSNLTADQLKGSAVVNCGDVELKLNESNYGLDAWQTEYVNITVEIKDKGGNAVTSLTNLTDDTTYTVSVTVAPKNEALRTSSGTPATAKTGSDKRNIYVFKPELTFKDSEVYYGAVAPTKAEYDANNLTGTKWAHKEQDNSVTYSTAVTMIGTAPELTLTYTPDSTKIADGKINTKQDIAVDVAVKIDGTNVTTDTTFKHTDCTGKTCTVPEGKEFLLHVKTCQLTITKNGGNANEPYVFTVFKDNEKYSEVTVMGGGSETICELPVGTYTIAEDTGWSWRFTPGYGSAVTLSKANAFGTIACSNRLSKPYWLNGFSPVVENVYGVQH